MYCGRCANGELAQAFRSLAFSFHVLRNLTNIPKHRGLLTVEPQPLFINRRPKLNMRVRAVA